MMWGGSTFLCSSFSICDCLPTHFQRQWQKASVLPQDTRPETQEVPFIRIPLHGVGWSWLSSLDLCLSFLAATPGTSNTGCQDNRTCPTIQRVQCQTLIYKCVHVHTHGTHAHMLLAALFLCLNLDTSCYSRFILCKYIIYLSFPS